MSGLTCVHLNLFQVMKGVIKIHKNIKCPKRKVLITLKITKTYALNATKLRVISKNNMWLQLYSMHWGTLSNMHVFVIESRQVYNWVLSYNKTLSYSYNKHLICRQTYKKEEVYLAIWTAIVFIGSIGL